MYSLQFPLRRIIIVALWLSSCVLSKGFSCASLSLSSSRSYPLYSLSLPPWDSTLFLKQKCLQKLTEFYHSQYILGIGDLLPFHLWTSSPGIASDPQCDWSSKSADAVEQNHDIISLPLAIPTFNSVVPQAVLHCSGLFDVHLQYKDDSNAHPRLP